MAISFSLNCERAVLFPVKCDLDPPFTTLILGHNYQTWVGCEGIIELKSISTIHNYNILMYTNAHRIFLLL